MLARWSKQMRGAKMSTFNKETEQYIEHEVKLRLHEKQLKSFEETKSQLENHEIQLKLHDEMFKNNNDKFKSLRESILRLENKIDSGLKHLDNKSMLMFSIILGSIWLPAILHYLHII